MARGGYQQPSRPAPVSGPGPLSKRTDGGPQAQRDLPDAAYGEQADFQQIQSGAPMQGGADLGALVGMQAGQSGPSPIPLTEPTARPDEPITTGSPSGPGPGPEAFGMGMSNRAQNEVDARKIAEYLPSLERQANQPGTPTSFVRFVKYLREFKE